MPWNIGPWQWDGWRTTPRRELHAVAAGDLATAAGASPLQPLLSSHAQWGAQRQGTSRCTKPFRACRRLLGERRAKGCCFAALGAVLLYTLLLAIAGWRLYESLPPAMQLTRVEHRALSQVQRTIHWSR